MTELWTDPHGPDPGLGYPGGDTVAGVCGWLVEVPSGNPEPDSLADTVMVVECGSPGVDERGLCEFHAGLMAMPDREFERMIDEREGEGRW